MAINITIFIFWIRFGIHINISAYPNYNIVGFYKFSYIIDSQSIG